MKNNIYVLFILSLLIVSSFMVGRLTAERRSEPTYTSDTVLITKTDTLLRDTIIEKTKFLPKKVEIIRRDTIKENTVLTYEQKVYEDTIAFDKDSILLTNVISGVDARLDSTHVQWKKQSKVITNTIYITKDKPRKLIEFVPLQTTAGYNPIDNKFGIVIGCGLSVNF